MGSLRLEKSVPRREAELAAAGLALEDRPARVAVADDAAAVRADGLAVRGRPPERPEGRPGLILGHTCHGRQREGAGLGGKQEVLRHRRHIRYQRNEYGDTATYCQWQT